MPTYDVWNIPITLTDLRGRTKIFVRPCVAVDRDYREEGSPVLLSMTTFYDHQMYLAAPLNHFWFGITPTLIECLSPHRFAKVTRNCAKVYAIVATPPQVFLPGDHDNDNEKPVLRKTEEIEPEFQRFKKVFEADRAKIVLPHGPSDHAIQTTPGEEPPFGPIYPLSARELKILKEYLDENEKAGRIRPSQSSAGAPILFVPKADGTLRLCVDYRGLNRITIKNRYPLPLISEILDRIQGAQWFTKLDIKDAYYRIRIREGDEWKTAFRTRYGHYEYMVMPFGLTNAPATFQSYIHSALYGLLDVICIVYLDDILIFSKTREEHTKHVCQVLQRLQSAELYANPKKCVFYQKQVEFLGYVISVDGVSMDPRRVQAIRDWKLPESYHDIQVFLGFCNFYRRFIPRYSMIACPLTNLLKGSVKGKKPGKVELNPSEIRAFRQLITAFQAATLLCHFDPAKFIRVETDASNIGMAGILSQPGPGGQWHPVAFWSRKFSGAELNYGTPDQELFAIVESFKHWRHYLDGSKFPVEVLSDHHNLQSFMKQPKLNGRQARWCMYLTPFDFVIKHRSGKSNPADGLSRQWDLDLGDARGKDLLLPIRDRLVPTSTATAVQCMICTAIPSLARSKDFTIDGESFTSVDDDNLIDGYPSDTSEGKSRNSSDASEVGYRNSSDASGVGCRNPLDVSKVDLRNSLDASEVENSSRLDPEGVKRLANLAACKALARDQRIPVALVQAACKAEKVYSAEADKDLQKLILRIQLNDDACKERRLSETLAKSKVWTVDPEGILRFKKRLFIPAGENLRQRIASLYHDDPLAGHFGVNRTETLLKRKFHWPNMHEDIVDFVRSCHICQRQANHRHKPYGKLESLPIPKRPWSEITMDFITGLPEVIHNGKFVNAILVIVDRYTKMCRFFSVSTSIDAAELAELFHSEIELKYGPPEGIVSDRGPIFTSEFWSQLCYLSKIKLRLSTAFHPQTDGQTERMNQTLEQYLRKFIDNEQILWAKLLSSAEYCCNNAPSATTAISPFFALMGYNPDFHIRSEDVSISGEVPAASCRVEKLKTLREELEKHWQSAVASQVKHYNAKHQPREYKFRDLVLLSTKNLKLKMPSKKLSPRFIGPFRVLQRVGQQAYRLALPKQYSRIHNVFHVSLLEPWNRRGNDTDTMPMPELEEDEEWEVEEIKEEKSIHQTTYFLVKWKDWPSEYNQWVPEEDMGNAQGAITKFRKVKNNKTARKRQ